MLFVKNVLRLFPSFLLIAICVTSAIAQQPAFTEPYGKNEKVGKYATVNGIKMYYEIYGQGQPMLLIHGNGGDIASMGNQIEYFSKYYKCIIADSRAHGKTEEGAGRLTYEQMADDWSALLDQLKMDSTYVIGWSDGGILGLLLAIHHPEKVKMLATMEANLHPDSSAVYAWAVDWVAKMDHAVDEMIVKKDKSQNWALEKKYLDLLGKQPNIPLSDLAKISAPTLIMSGDRDVIREEHSLQIYQHIPHSHLCIFPGETHMIPATDPELFNMMVHRFFKKPFTRPDTKEYFK